jgi:uncharacterized protein YndB with AHSA1/START domain
MMTDNVTQDAVVIERRFDASPDLIWQMWTDPEHFRAWYGPTDAAVTVAKMDVRVGGSRLVCIELETPGAGMQMWFTGEFREVVTNKRLVYTEAISDENGTVLPAPDAGPAVGHPVTTVVTVELQDIDGCTRMTLTHAGIPADSAGAAGWTIALDKLTAFVEAHGR